MGTTLSMNPDEYIGKDMNITGAIDGFNPCWVEVPAMSSNVLTIHKYANMLKLISEALTLYETLLEKDSMMLLRIHDTYVKADQASTLIIR